MATGTTRLPRRSRNKSALVSNSGPASESADAARFSACVRGVMDHGASTEESRDKMIRDARNLATITDFQPRRTVFSAVNSLERAAGRPSLLTTCGAAQRRWRVVPSRHPPRALSCPPRDRRAAESAPVAPSDQGRRAPPCARGFGRPRHGTGASGAP